MPLQCGKREVTKYFGSWHVLNYTLRKSLISKLGRRKWGIYSIPWGFHYLEWLCCILFVFALFQNTENSWRLLGNVGIRVFFVCHVCYWVCFKIIGAKIISYHDTHSRNEEINKTAHYQQLQIQKCAMSHCDAKGQGSRGVIKILVDFVNLVVGGKENTKNNLGCGNRYIHITVYLVCHIKM